MSTRLLSSLAARVASPLRHLVFDPGPIQTAARGIIRRLWESELFDLAVHDGCITRATVGAGSRFYRQASVVNLQGDPSRIRVGENSHIRGEMLIFPFGGEISIGDWSFLGAGARIWCGERVSIGNHVGIGHGVNLLDFAHETDATLRAEGFRQIFTTGHPREKGEIPTAPIIIEDHAIVYAGAIISRGVRVGRGAIVSAGSVVMNDVAPFTLVMGNPARVMMKLEPK